MDRERVRLTREQARRALRRLPGILIGQEPDPTGEVRRLKEELGKTVLDLVRERFLVLSQGAAYEGERWKALAASTVKAKARKGRAPFLNVDTQALFLSLAWREGPSGVEVYTPVSYAPFVHASRPLWPAPKDWCDRWDRVVRGVILQGVARVAVGLLRGAR